MVDLGMNDHEISVKLGVDFETLRKMVYRHRLRPTLPGRGWYDPELFVAYQEMIANGVGYHEACDMLGVARRHWAQGLMRRGIPLPEGITTKGEKRSRATRYRKETVDQ